MRSLIMFRLANKHLIYMFEQNPRISGLEPQNTRVLQKVYKVHNCAIVTDVGLEVDLIHPVLLGFLLVG